ncbi:MAG: hypothetical protein LBM75_08905, partial [Myxococcales bacterium]|nr:hypothetical protein [Myxococcales bacterium]
TISEQLFETPILEAEVYAEASALPIAEPVAEADFLAEAPVFEAIAVAEEILEPLIAESALVVEPIADEPILEAELYGEASMLPIAESGAESGVDFVSSDFILDEAPALSPLPERPFSEPSPSHLPTTTPDVAMVEGEPHRLEQELDAAKAESEQAKAALDAAHAESEALKAERDAIRAELAAFRADFDTAKAESDQAKAERDAACAETEAAKAERDAIRAELAVFRTDFDTAKAESDQARAGFEAGRAETEALKAERDALQAQTEELEANLALSEERASKNYLKLRNDEQLRAKARKALDVALALLAATESVPIEPLPGERAQGDRAVKSLEELAIAATASANEAPQQAEGA